MEKNFARWNFIGEKKRKKEIFFFLLEKHQQLDAIQDESGEKRASPIVFVDWAQKTRQQNKKERKKERKKLVTVHQTMDGSNGRIPLVTLSPAGANPSPNSSSSGGIIILFSNTSTSSTNVEGSTLEYLIDAVELLRPPPCLHRVKNCHHLN